MKTILRYIKPYWRGVLLASIAILVSTGCDLMLPTIMSDVLNFGIHNKDFSYVLISCGKMLVIALIGFASVLYGAWCSTCIVSGFCADVRRDVFKRVNTMSFDEFGKLGTAPLVTRATHDVETVSWVASELSGTIVTIPVLFFGGLILSFQKDVVLSLLLLVFVPVILVVVMLVGKRILPLWEKSDEYIDRQNHLVRQRLRGIRVIRAFNAESKEHENIADATRVMAENIIKSNVSMGLIAPVATFLLNAATVIVVYFGGVRLEKSTGLSGGDIFAIVQYIALVSNAIIMGAFSLIMFPHAKVAAKRIGQVLNNNDSFEPTETAFRNLNGDICFENVSYTYDGAAEQALSGISLEICRGERVAIIGGTGSGKSTIVSMLLGFRVPTEGEIRIDGVSVPELGNKILRDNISCVLQSSSIYSGTISDNIKLGKPDATDLEIKDALNAAQAMEFIDSFSGGMQHEIKQSGKNLSGGQKQRICIARALVKDAPVYIFDDSFSALDFITEYKLRKALTERLSGKTQIIITQRVSTAMHTDRIYVIDKGILVGVGDHKSLLTSCDIYRQIYASQTGGAEE